MTAPRPRDRPDPGFSRRLHRPRVLDVRGSRRRLDDSVGRDGDAHRWSPSSARSTRSRRPWPMPRRARRRRPTAPASARRPRVRARRTGRALLASLQCSTGSRIPAGSCAGRSIRARRSARTATRSPAVPAEAASPERSARAAGSDDRLASGERRRTGPARRVAAAPQGRHGRTSTAPATAPLREQRLGGARLLWFQFFLIRTPAADSATAKRRPAAAHVANLRLAHGSKIRTLILIRPDAFERGYRIEAISRFERKDLFTRWRSSWSPRHRPPTALRRHRQALLRRLVLFHHRGPLVAIVLEGHRSRRARR